MTSYAILGAGAIGGFFGGRLHLAGHKVHFVDRSQHDHLRREGFVVESPGETWRTGPVAASATLAEVPPVDVVLVCLKTTQTADLGAQLAPLLRPGLQVALLQNGLEGEARCAPQLPGATVLGAICFIACTKVAPGRLRHFAYQGIGLGEHAGEGRPAGTTPAVEARVADLADAGVDAQPEPDLRLARWRKLVWNVPFNGLSTLLDATTQELLGTADNRALVADLMEEIVGGAHAECAVRTPDDPGRRLPPDLPARMLELTDRMPPYPTSMKVDFDHGRPLEVEAVLGEPVRAAAAAGRELPRARLLHRAVAFLDRRARKA